MCLGSYLKFSRICSQKYIYWVTCNCIKFREVYSYNSCTICHQTSKHSSSLSYFLFPFSVSPLLYLPPSFPLSLISLSPALFPPSLPPSLPSLSCHPHHISLGFVSPRRFTMLSVFYMIIGYFSSL